MGKHASSSEKAAHLQPSLTVTAQQSRFSSEATEGSASTEITVKDLSIHIGKREILSHATLHLQPQQHYVLIGRNGVGKSTLLRAIAEGSMPGVPRSLHVLLLGQLDIDSDNGSEDTKSTRTVIEHVLHSNKERERLLNHSSRITEAMENTNDPTAVPKVFRELTRERLSIEVSEAQVMAEKTSGARGATARGILTKLEAELAQSESRLEALTINPESEKLDSTEMSQDTVQAMELLSNIKASLDMMDAATAEVKARAVLRGLGFSSSSLDQPMSRLSGGWRTRCSLACALCQPSDLLLLDEPTNFLDLPSIIWLEKFVQELTSTTVIVVTHDRTFADNVADELLVLRNLDLEHFKGNVSGYEYNRLKTYKYLSRMQAAQDKQMKHMQASIDQNVKAAKRSGDDKKLKQVTSRQKKLDERMGMQVSAKGTKFKLSRDLAGFHSSKRDAIELPTFDPPVRIALPSQLTDLRFPGPLLSFEKVCFSYGDKGTDLLLRDIDLTIYLGDRLGVAGLNGSGKSTLISLAMGAVGEADKKALRSSKGVITSHPRARIGHYSQQAVEELKALAVSEPKLSALAHLLENAGPDLSEKDARTLLANLGIAGNTVSSVPLALLSGGQLVRLALAKILHTPPHLLILDEVTTHLDADTIQSLALAFQSYEGALWVVTHDRFFMRCVVEGASPKSIAQEYQRDSDEDEEDSSESDEEDSEKHQGTVYRLTKGKLSKLEGGMQKYEVLAEKATAKLGGS